jgi:hypothetical protein
MIAINGGHGWVRTSDPSLVSSRRPSSGRSWRPVWVSLAGFGRGFVRTRTLALLHALLHGQSRAWPSRRAVVLHHGGRRPARVTSVTHALALAGRWPPWSLGSRGGWSAPGTRWSIPERPGPGPEVLAGRCGTGKVPRQDAYRNSGDDLSHVRGGRPLSRRCERRGTPSRPGWARRAGGRPGDRAGKGARPCSPARAARLRGPHQERRTKGRPSYGNFCHGALP